jgi:hypothetical protein
MKSAPQVNDNRVPSDMYVSIFSHVIQVGKNTLYNFIFFSIFAVVSVFIEGMIEQLLDPEFKFQV